MFFCAPVLSPRPTSQESKSLAVHTSENGFISNIGELISPLMLYIHVTYSDTVIINRLTKLYRLMASLSKNVYGLPSCETKA